MDEKKGKKFIEEKILGRNLTWERTLKYLGLSLACGLVFGLAAVGIFYLLVRPAMAKPEETPAVTSEAVSEPVSEPVAPETEPEPETPWTEPAITEPETTETESAAETASAETEEETTGAQSEESIEEILPEETGESESGAEVSETSAEQEQPPAEGPKQDAASLRDAVRPCLVRAEVVASAETWFDSTVETRQSFSGVVLQKTEDEILVLVPMGAVDAEQKLVVTFDDGTQRNGIPKAYSRRDGLAVLAVPIAGMSKAELENILPAEYSDAEMKEGMWLMAAGAPLGINGSVDGGIAGYVSGTENDVDTSFSCLYSSLRADYGKGTYVFDEEGKLLGIALPSSGGKVCEGTRIVWIRSLERLINNMKSGSDSPYLGITGADSEAPEGMYVTGVEVDSPVYEAGLKRGDVIVMAGIREIHKVEDIVGFMKNLHPGETVMLEVKRADGSGGFADIDIEVVAGTRN